MSIKVSPTIENLSNILLGLPLVGTATSNSYYLAFAIVVIIVLIASFVYGDSSWSSIARMLIWGYIATTALLLLRDTAEAANTRERGREKLAEEIFMSAPGPAPVYNAPPPAVNFAEAVEARAQAIAAARAQQYAPPPQQYQTQQYQTQQPQYSTPQYSAPQYGVPPSNTPITAK